MTAPAVATPVILAEAGQPECGDRSQGDHARCARPSGHKGGHVDRRLQRYWQAEELASVTR